MEWLDEMITSLQDKGLCTIHQVKDPSSTNIWSQGQLQT